MEPHEVLGVDPDADPEEVRAAYRRLVREHHPDRHATATERERAAAAERMAEITEAFQLLSDPGALARRRARTHRATGPGQPPPPPDDGFDYRSAAPSEFTDGPTGRWSQTPPPPPPTAPPGSRTDRSPGPGRGGRTTQVFAWLLVITIAVAIWLVVTG